MRKSQVNEAVISSRGAARIRAGHLWVYRSDLTQIPTTEGGSIVRVLDPRGRFLALGHYGSETEISLRIISTEETEIDRDFWLARLKNAANWRKQIVNDSDAYRLVHAEGDLLPGLIIDRYGSGLAIQTLTQGMEALKEMWVELLQEEFKPSLIVERNDAKVRQLEGLPMINNLLYSDSTEPECEVMENGIKFRVNLLTGQKTGAFLDQRENRAAALRYAFGLGLDCFSYDGSFALHLARNCEQVTALEISPTAIERARTNAGLNNLSNIEFIEANVFDRLHEYDNAGRRFDSIVLDPPAFAKNRGAVKAALRGYKEINLRALKLLNPGGVLVSCSCSYHVGEDLFLGMLAAAAQDAGRTLQIVEKRTQARDHPILLTVPETYYLKCIVLRVIPG